MDHVGPAPKRAGVVCCFVMPNFLKQARWMHIFDVLGDIVQVTESRSLFMLRVGDFIRTFQDNTDTQQVDLTLREINGGHR